MCIVVIDVALYFAKNIKSTKTTFINNKSSKLTHFKLNNPENKDIVFIGSSTTFYHISTNIFKNNDIDIYNFGVSGLQFEDYPALLSEVKKYQPRKVVISLPVTKLYEELNVAKQPYIQEIRQYYNIDKMKFINSLYNWVVNKHLFLEYSEAILFRLKSLYAKFNPLNNATSAINAATVDDKILSHQPLVDCKPFDIKNTKTGKQTIKCTNGDGILVGKVSNQRVRALNKFDYLNRDSILYISKMINNLKGIEDVIIILEPILNNKYQYNLNTIKKELDGSTVIDLTNHSVSTNKKIWWNINHLNYEGRRQYSQYLASILSGN
jgi:hypothetical protein